MRGHRLLIVAAVLAIFAAGCDWPNITPPGAAPVRYRDQVFADTSGNPKVTVTNNVHYGSAVDNSGQAVDLQYDEYAPTGDTNTSRPAIVWIHGGSFCCGDKTSAEIVDEAKHFAGEGYVGFSISYRLEPGGCTSVTQTCIIAIEEAAADAQTAVAYVRSHAANLGVDPNRIAVAGTSAGAITALNLAYASSEAPPSMKVRAAVSLSGANLVVGTVSAGDAPAIDFHGTADPLVPYSWAQSTETAAKDAGLDFFLETFQDAGHVPYQFRTQILTQSTNFLYWEMDLSHAAQ